MRPKPELTGRARQTRSFGEPLGFIAPLTRLEDSRHIRRRFQPASTAGCSRERFGCTRGGVDGVPNVGRRTPPKNAAAKGDAAAARTRRRARQISTTASTSTEAATAASWAFFCSRPRERTSNREGIDYEEDGDFARGGEIVAILTGVKTRGNGEADGDAGSGTGTLQPVTFTAAAVAQGRS